MPVPGPGSDARSEPEMEDSASRRDRTDGGDSDAPSLDRVRGLAVDPSSASVRTTASGRDDGAGTDGTGGTDGTTETDRASDDESLSPTEYVVRVHELVYEDPVAAGDRVGDLLVLAEEDDPELRETAGETLAWLGERRPREFEVWADDLAAFAERSDPDLAFLGLRALAQLAPYHESAAMKGLQAAIRRIDAGREDLRAAALALVAEVGAERAHEIGDADRPIAASMAAESARVRTAAAIAAGNLLAAAPQRFPRTAMALLDALEDPDDGVRAFAHVALISFATEHPSVVPEKETAIAALEEVTDDELGLRDGAVAEAQNALLRFRADYR